MIWSREQKPWQADQYKFSQQCSHMKDPHPNSETFREASKTLVAFERQKLFSPISQWLGNPQFHKLCMSGKSNCVVLRNYVFHKHKIIIPQKHNFIILFYNSAYDMVHRKCMMKYMYYVFEAIPWWLSFDKQFLFLLILVEPILDQHTF